MDFRNASAACTASGVGCSGSGCVGAEIWSCPGFADDGSLSILVGDFLEPTSESSAVNFLRASNGGKAGLAAEYRDGDVDVAIRLLMWRAVTADERLPNCVRDDPALVFLALHSAS